MIRKLISEPLVHFFLIALVLYGVNEWSADPVGSAPILISERQLQQFADYHHDTFGISPTSEAVAHYVKTLVEEEALYRQGVLLGLDQDDMIVRRRIIQKVKFLLQDTALAALPDDETLFAHYQANAEQYQQPPVASFRHLYFSADIRSSQAALTRATTALDSKKGLGCTSSATADVREDLFPGTNGGDNLTPVAVKKLFGDFPASQAVFSVVQGQWQGPFESGLGWHLICVESRQDIVSRPFESVKRDVLQDYLDTQKARRYADTMDKILARYLVEVPQVFSQ